MEEQIATVDEVTIEQPSKAADNLLTPERATELIRREKEAAYRKAQREFQAELDRLKTGQTQNLGSMQTSEPLNKDELFKEFRSQLEKEFEASQEQLKQQEYEKFVGDQARTYLDKMAKSAEIADDFKEMTARFKPEAFQEVFYLANSFENTPQIVYDLMKNPTKLTHIDYLAKRDPDLARSELEALSKSIQFNEAALKNNVATEPPLSRIQPSISAGKDAGEMGLQDLKNAPWLRV